MPGDLPPFEFVNEVVPQPALQIWQSTEPQERRIVLGEPPSVWTERGICHQDAEVKGRARGGECTVKIANVPRTGLRTEVMMLNLNPYEKRNGGGPWVRDNVNTAVLPIHMTDELRLEAKAIKPIRNEVLESLGTQFSQAVGIIKQPPK